MFDCLCDWVVSGLFFLIQQERWATTKEKIHMSPWLLAPTDMVKSTMVTGGYDE